PRIAAQVLPAKNQNKRLSMSFPWWDRLCSMTALFVRSPPGCYGHFRGKRHDRPHDARARGRGDCERPGLVSPRCAMPFASAASRRTFLEAWGGLMARAATQVPSIAAAAQVTVAAENGTS